MANSEQNNTEKMETGTEKTCHGQWMSKDYEPGLVSVIIPTYNRENLILETLDSILGQTYQNWECIIVDDGSTNETLEVVKQYCSCDARFRLYERPPERRKGANTCRNIGLKVSVGEFVHLFDSDDLMHPRNIEKKVEVLRKNPEFDFAVCQMHWFEGDPNNIVRTHTNIKSEDCFEDHVYHKMEFFTPGPLWRRTFLQSLDKLFDEDLSCGQEYEFHSRVLLHSQSYGTVEEALVLYRIHPKSISANRARRDPDYCFASFRTKKKVYALAKTHGRLSVSMVDYFFKVSADHCSGAILMGSQQYLSEILEFANEIAPKNYRGAWYLWNLRLAMLANKYLSKRIGWLLFKTLNKLFLVTARQR